jgi:hypothetical protein
LVAKDGGKRWWQKMVVQSALATLDNKAALLN